MTEARFHLIEGGARVKIPMEHPTCTFVLVRLDMS